MAFWYLGRFLGCLVNRVVPRFHPLLLARLMSLCAAITYALLAGFALPTVRAVIMVVCVLVLGGLQRRGALFRALMAALLLMLLLDPLDILSAAFWLSFLAVALLCASVHRASDDVKMPGRQQSWFSQAAGWLARSSASQVMLSFGLALPTLVFFGQVSLVAIAANLIAVPVFSLFLLPVVLFGAALMLAGLWPGDFMLNAGAQGLAILLELLAILADLPGAIRAPSSYGAFTFVLAALATLAVLLPRPLPGRVCALALLVAALHAGRLSPKPKLTVQVLDVGQGLSVLVQTESHALLYDTGASWRNGDAGLSFVLPALRFAGVRRLDTLVISHADTDHSGGAEIIIQELPVERILAADLHSQKHFDGQGCYAGMHWWWDHVEFRVLHPDAQHDWSENNGSCVLLVRSGASTLLLPGDIERAAELSLVGRHDLSSTDLVLAPHHGSKTSSTAVFVQAATARHVVFSAAYANRWGFPRPEIVARWSAGGSCVLLTSVSGSLHFLATETGGFRLVNARRSSMLRPWPIRNRESMRCVNTINGADGGV